MRLVNIQRSNIKEVQLIISCYQKAVSHVAMINAKPRKFVFKKLPGTPLDAVSTLIDCSKTKTASS
ncbi:MAG: hypothetical protein CMM16_04930 [Rhodospirillaceae bacterium]|nr:hypothetical protein [Rhodospirillaceae bacterium]